MRSSVVRAPSVVAHRSPRYHRAMADEFDPQAMVERFRARAEAVRSRGLPPVEGPDRSGSSEQAQADFMDFAMMGDAEPTIEDGVLAFRIDLRPPATPKPERTGAGPPGARRPDPSAAVVHAGVLHAQDAGVSVRVGPP